MSRQSLIRQEINQAQFKANVYLRRYLTTHSSMYLEWHKHYASRVKFFLNELLKVQLKEFNHD